MYLSRLTTAILLQILLAGATNAVKWDSEKVKEASVTFPNVQENTETTGNEEDLAPGADEPGAELKQPKEAGRWSRKLLNGKLSGGPEVMRGQFPWQASLVVDQVLFCSGSLVLKNWVLTAAHCVSNASAVTVNLGSFTKDDLRSATIQAARILVHENFGPESLHNNLALLQMSSEAKLMPGFIELVKLPLATEANKTLEGLMVVSSGLTKAETSDKKNKAVLKLDFPAQKVISNTACQSFYGSGIISAGILCTNFTDSGTITKKSNCLKGLSGGSLVFQDKSNTWVQIGIVSFTSSEGCSQGPTGHVRVASHLGWISSRIENGTSALLSAENPSKKPNRIDKNTCRSSNFQKLHECCENPPADLVPFNPKEKICSNNKQKMSIFNEYILNKGQHSNVNFTVFFYDIQTQDLLRHQACFVNCIFSARGAITDEVQGVINSEAVVRLLKENQKDEAWGTKVETSFRACENLLLDYQFQLPFVESYGKWCNVTAAALVQCTQFQLIQLCEKQKSTGSCNSKRNAFNACAGTAFRGQLLTEQTMK
ncbi:polyserase-2-like [Cloeon dipterum]|uniref:polyserase-2-like n=1 Tax=Cloeon dipterum TaxID=197152 RepID=UPI00321FC038